MAHAVAVVLSSSQGVAAHAVVLKLGFGSGRRSDERRRMQLTSKWGLVWTGSSDKGSAIIYVMSGGSKHILA